ncbi:hypothetical protein C9426_01795 [Serratia sp. S1B]|nr:hypothetical protein C9426_01795 [Serratia sp. S1B]
MPIAHRCASAFTKMRKTTYIECMPKFIDNPYMHVSHFNHCKMKLKKPHFSMQLILIFGNQSVFSQKIML